MHFPRFTSFLAFLLVVSNMLAAEPPDSSTAIPAPSSDWVQATLAGMTLEEKIGQLIMARTFGHFISRESDEYDRLVRLVQDQKVGGLVVFQGDVVEVAVLLNSLQKRAKVPLLVAGDFERGLAMRIRRGTAFPEAMAVSATRDPGLAYRAGRAIATEARAIGVHQNLAPVADVNNNPMNPVINTRSFGEDPRLVAEMVAAFVRGTNDGGALSTVKHFPGHGDTGVDSHLDLPVLPFDRERLDDVELVSFRKAIAEGVGSVMMAHLAVPSIDSTPGRPATLSPAAVDGLLRTELGFGGLIVTDAMEMRGILNSYSVGESAVMAVQAGVDVLLLPADELVAADAILDAVKRGVLPESRIDRSVERVLRVKQSLGLHTNRLVDVDRIPEVVGTDEHVLLAKEIARRSITLLKNEYSLLPMRSVGAMRTSLVIISDSEEGRVDVNRPSSQLTNEPVGAYFGQQFRNRVGSVRTYRLNPSTTGPEIDSTIRALGNSDLVVVGLFARVRSQRGTVALSGNLERFARELSGAGRRTLVLSFGNPYLVELFPAAGGLVCAYSEGEIVVESALEAMFGEIPVGGLLPITIPGGFERGDGIRLEQIVLRRDHPAVAGFDKERLDLIDSLVVAAIRDSAFPGAQVAVVRNGVLAFNKSFGRLTYDLSSPAVTSSTLFDLASLTKVVATTAAVMKLYDRGMIKLEDRVNEYLPLFQGEKKDEVTLRHLLTHTSGLPAYRAFFRCCTSPTQALDSLYATPLVASPGDSVIYSDPGMMLLGRVVEAVSGLTLDVFVRNEFFAPLRMQNTMFNPLSKGMPSVAPTEVDTIWRRRTLQGEVHDENASLFGGVSGHAGLFSTAGDLAKFMRMLMNGGTYGGVRYLRESTVREFTEKGPDSGTRALGWDTKSAKQSSAGDLFSMKSFGHTGFTGTSIWADPERDLFVVLLTNRVYPTRTNQKISRVRPQLHDLVVRALVNPPPPGRER
jgi:beta-glucosidase-like glycosyl hydrolase/CubicO group peptidase (beta-lactamase class C family)